MGFILKKIYEETGKHTLAHQLAYSTHPLASTTTYSPSARNVEERRPEEILMAFTMMEIMIMFSSRNGLLRTPIKGLRKQCKPPP